MERFVREVVDNLYERVEFYLQDYVTVNEMPERQEIREKAIGFLEQEGYTSLNTAAIMLSLNFEADGEEFNRIVLDKEYWCRGVLDFAEFIRDGKMPPFGYNWCEILDRDPDDPNTGKDWGFYWFEKPVEFSTENIYEMLNR